MNTFARRCRAWTVHRGEAAGVVVMTFDNERFPIIQLLAPIRHAPAELASRMMR